MPRSSNKKGKVGAQKRHERESLPPHQPDDRVKGGGSTGREKPRRRNRETLADVDDSMLMSPSPPPPRPLRTSPRKHVATSSGQRRVLERREKMRRKNMNSSDLDDSSGENEDFEEYENKSQEEDSEEEDEDEDAIQGRRSPPKQRQDVTSYKRQKLELGIIQEEKSFKAFLKRDVRNKIYPYVKFITESKAMKFNGPLAGICMKELANHLPQNPTESAKRDFWESNADFIRKSINEMRANSNAELRRAFIGKESRQDEVCRASF